MSSMKSEQLGEQVRLSLKIFLFSTKQFEVLQTLFEWINSFWLVQLVH